MALLGALIASGAAGLIYQISWIRSASLLVGSTTHALAIVLATFFGGLALGSALFGRLAQRSAHPVRLYAILEAGVAALGLLSLAAFPAADWLLTRLSRAAGDAPLVWLAEIVVLTLILTPPAVLMGGTLPLFARHLITEQSRILSRIAWIYAINTLGAAAGCLLAGLTLIPSIGVRFTIVVAAALNLTAAAIAFRQPVVQEVEAVQPFQKSGAASTLMMTLFFITGAAALANEVLWTRFAALLTANTATTYTVTIAIVLVGIALGSLAVVRVRRQETSAFALGALQAALAIWVLVVTHFEPSVWSSLGSRVWMYVLLFLPPAVASGASFPLAVRAVTSEARRTAVRVGQLGAANMAGGVAGAIAAGYLLPWIGLDAGLRVTTALSLVAAWLAWLALPASRRTMMPLVLSVATGLAWVAIGRQTPTRLPDAFLTRNGMLVAAREGVQSNLAVSRADGMTLLTSDHWWQGQDEKTHQIMAAHVPMLFHPAPRDVLVVGVGAGQTPARFTLYDIARLDAVDIDPVIFEVVRDYFPSSWMDDPRVHLVAADGRTHVQRTAQRYDVISIEVGQLLRPGTGAFYTQAFYERVRDRLNDNGIVSQFVPLSFLTPDDFHDVVRTFLAVFPRAVLWFNRTEPLLIGTNGSTLSIAPGRLALLEAPGPIRDDLAFNLWGSQPQNQPGTFLSSFLAGADRLAAIAARGEILTDDRPVLEYRAGAVVPERIGQYPIEAELGREPTPIESIAPALSPELIARAAAIRAQHLREIAARAALAR